jgi:hypothetical protein
MREKNEDGCGTEDKIISLPFLARSYRLPSVADIVNKSYLACWLNNKRIVSAANARGRAPPPPPPSVHVTCRHGRERYNDVA